MAHETPQKTAVRRYARIKADISVRVFRDGVPTSLARAHDVSCGGMCLYAPLELKEEEVIKIAFELPHSRMQFGVSAVVRNRNGFRYGVEFVNLSPEEHAEIQRITAILNLVQQ